MSLNRIVTSSARQPDGAVTLDDVRAARDAIRGVASETPVIPCPELSERAGVPVSLKLETTQPTGAFKLRGAANAVARLSEKQAARGVVCASTGNHGRAVAYAARQREIRAVVCLSSLVPAAKVAAVEAMGGTVRRVGRSQDEAQAEVDRLVAEEGLAEIPPFDDPLVVAGQGTIGLELARQVDDLASVVVPLSGGGLIGGIAVALKALKPKVRVIGVSAAAGPTMFESLRAGRPVAIDERPSLADSLGGGIGLENRVTFELCRRLVDDIVLLDEAEIYRAMRFLFEKARLVTEGAGAAAAAAVLEGRIALTAGPTALIVSGNNVDMTEFLAVVSGRPVRIGDADVIG